MEEMQITPEQFEVAVLAGKQNPGGTTLPFHQGLFQQVRMRLYVWTLDIHSVSDLMWVDHNE